MTSFPYFAISRQHLADYGLVLAYASMQESLLTFEPPQLDEQMIEAANELSEEVHHQIKVAVYHEYKRRGAIKFGRNA